MPLGVQQLVSLNRAFGVLSIAIGIFFLAGGGWWIHHNHIDLFLFGSIAEGYVIENKPAEVPANIYTKSQRLAGTVYHTVVQFTTGDRRTMTYTDGFGFNPPSFQKGQHVKLFYYPRNPEEAMLDRGAGNFIIPCICSFAGLILIYGGIRRLTTP